MSRYRRTSQSDNSGGFGSGGDRGSGEGGLNGEMGGGGSGPGGDLPEWCTDDTGFEGGFDATGQFMAQDDPYGGGELTIFTVFVAAVPKSRRIRGQIRN